MATVKTSFPGQQRRTSATSRAAAGQLRPVPKMISEEHFLHILQLEKRRTERSGRSFALVLISGEGLKAVTEADSESGLILSIAACIRDTDVFGWYDHTKATLGLIMTEIGAASPGVIESIVRKISLALQNSLDPEVYCQIAIVVRMFPQESEDRVFRVDRPRGNAAVWVDNSLKRCMDIAVSAVALMLLSPIFLVIAILVKLTSKGPVFYCKTRVGQYGKEFSFYKFRTMIVNNDHGIHRDYVLKLIAGTVDPNENGGMFKLKNDPRITSVGRFLRRTSLDELPQFFNVLMNDMSLVGPRPPLPYEYEHYCAWHKRRVLDLKPGITGLWQVEARSLTTFDEMARIDIRYATARNLWLDLKIMLRTPAAMLSGRGAC